MKRVHGRAAGKENWRPEHLQRPFISQEIQTKDSELNRSFDTAHRNFQRDGTDRAFVKSDSSVEEVCHHVLGITIKAIPTPTISIAMKKRPTQ